jgi:hypothetical protein
MEVSTMGVPNSWMVYHGKSYSGWWLKTTIFKNDRVKVNGKLDIPYMKWKKYV